MEIGKVQLQYEDSLRYAVYRDHGEADWEHQFPPGEGWVQLGPNNQTFMTTMYHQLHCLRRIRNALVTGSASEGRGVEGVTSCLNYLRQINLCAADVTLVPMVDESFAVVDYLSEHTCRDWSTVYAETEKNYWQYH